MHNYKTNLNSLILSFSRNIDSLAFKEFCEHLTEELQKLHENSNADSILKLKDMEDSNENLNRTSPPGKIFCPISLKYT